MNLNISGVGGILALVALILALLLMFGVIPMTALVVGGLIALLAAARIC